ncbi:MAG: hypothetical protein OQK82_01550 [Candidatus Pacearchaeota archaeon]|nr:hypothetical protein [Candidatus Pacearchaeota archaeon]
MAVIIPLNKTPNQSLSVNLDGYVFDIQVKALDDVMAASVTVDDEVVVQNIRVLSGVPLIPFTYLEKGNLIFVADASSQEEIPYYSGFGESFTLVYFTQSELEELRNA